MELRKDMLLDTWEVKGSDFEQLYEVTEAIDRATKYVPMKTNELGLFTLNSMSSDAVNGYLHNKVGSAIITYEMNDLYAKHGATPELISELKNNSMMLFDLGGHLFYTTHSVLKTLCQRAGSPMGDAALRREPAIRFHRDALYASYMRTVPSDCHVIFREAEGAKKVIAVLTDRHAPISQTESISTAIDGFSESLGKPNLKWFRINQYETVIYVEYPEQSADFSNVVRENQTVTIPADVIPGIMIRTSDSGDSSFTVIGPMKIGSTIVYVPSAHFARAHTKRATVDAIAKELEKKVFVEFTKVPERLCDLMMIDIFDPVSIVAKIAKHCAIKKMLGLGVENDVVNNISCELNPTINYSAYDIAMMFLREGARLEKERNRDDTINRIRNCFVQALFFKYEEL